MDGTRGAKPAPGGSGPDGAGLLQLQRLAGNDAVGALISVQRQGSLEDDLANIDDDSASIAAVLENAERGAARAGYTEARAAYARGDFLHAADQFEAAAAAATGEVRLALLQNAAQAYERQGLTLGVPGAQGVERDDRGPVENAELMRQFEAAAAAFAADDVRGALRQFQQIYEQAPLAEVVWNLAMAEYRLGLYADARDHFGDFSSRGGSGADPGPWLRRCDRQLAGSPQLSQRDLAALDESPEASLDAVVNESGQADVQAEVGGQVAEGVRLFRAQEFEAALRSFNGAAAQMPNDPSLAWDVARALHAANQPEQAVAAYRRLFGR